MECGECRRLFLGNAHSDKKPHEECILQYPNSACPQSMQQRTRARLARMGGGRERCSAASVAGRPAPEARLG